MLCVGKDYDLMSPLFLNEQEQNHLLHHNFVPMPQFTLIPISYWHFNLIVVLIRHYSNNWGPVFI